MKKENLLKFGGYIFLFLVISLAISFFRGGSKVNSSHLKEIRGEEALKFENSGNQIKVLYFWATWCGVCKVNLPFIKSNYSFFKDKIYFLSIEEGQSREELEKYIQMNEINFPVVQGSPAVMNNFDVSGFPTTLFINGKNQVVFSDSGIVNPVSFYLRIIWLQLF